MSRFDADWHNGWTDDDAERLVAKLQSADDGESDVVELSGSEARCLHEVSKSQGFNNGFDIGMIVSGAILIATPLISRAVEFIRRKIHDD